jgi:hypothetical protein
MTKPFTDEDFDTLLAQNPPRTLEEKAQRAVDIAMRWKSGEITREDAIREARDGR